MSKRIFNQIQKMLGAEPDPLAADRKESTVKLRDAIDLLEQRLEIETTNREQANKMNIQLHNKLKKAEILKNKQEMDVPSGYLLINEEILKALHQQLADLKQRKIDRRDEHDDQSSVEIRHRKSERSGCGDTNQLHNIRIHQEMTGRIQQEYADTVTSEQTEPSNITEDQLISEDEANLFRANKGKMKSVYTMLNESFIGSETTRSDQN